MEFVLEFVSPEGLAAGADTCGISRLDHELFYNSVENATIVVIVFGQTTEILHCLGTFSWKKFAVDVTSIRMNCCRFKQFWRGRVLSHQVAHSVFVRWPFIEHVPIGMIPVSPGQQI